jgi:hypothetical protein
LGDGESKERDRLRLGSDDRSGQIRDGEVSPGHEADRRDHHPNVIELASFRRAGTATPQRPLPPSALNRSFSQSLGDPLPARALIFYISESGRWLEMLRDFENLEIVDIRSTESLRQKLMGRTPEIILLESSFQWACPFETIDRLDYLLEVPMVLICDRDGETQNAEFIKKAFAAGVHDTLYTPLKKDDLSETLEVLLKLHRHTGAIID